ncbi:hypothetical protein VPH35_040635 [Triticum aestivum]
MAPPTRRAGGQGCAAINDDVLHEILLRLPAKSLCRLRAVCRSWGSLLSAPSFIAAHRARQAAPLLVVHGRGQDGYAADVHILDMASGESIKRVRTESTLSVDLPMLLHTPRDLVGLTDGWFRYFRLRVLDPATGADFLLPDADPDKHPRHQSFFLPEDDDPYTHPRRRSFLLPDDDPDTHRHRRSFFSREDDPYRHPRRRSFFSPEDDDPYTHPRRRSFLLPEDDPYTHPRRRSFFLHRSFFLQDDDPDTHRHRRSFMLGRASTGDCKVLYIGMSPRPNRQQFCKVLTLSVDHEWRETGCPPARVMTGYSGGAAAVKGVAYFFPSVLRAPAPGNKGYIMAYDLEKEVWRSASVPAPAPGNKKVVNELSHGLAELGGCLALMYGDEHGSMELWLLVDPDQAIWSMQCTITVPYRYQGVQGSHLPLDVAEPLWLLEDGRIIMWMWMSGEHPHGVLCMYDPRTMTYTDVADMPNYTLAGVYTGSLLGRWNLRRLLHQGSSSSILLYQLAIICHIKIFFPSIFSLLRVKLFISIIGIYWLLIYGDNFYLYSYKKPSW